MGVRVLLVRGGNNKRMAHVFAIRAIPFIIEDDGKKAMMVIGDRGVLGEK